MPVFAESSSATTIADQIKLRKHRELQPISTETDSNPHIPRTSKSNTIISSLFHSHFTGTPPDQTKKKGATFRGLGCTSGAAQQVSLPAVIMSSAVWEGKRVKKKKGHQKRKKESLKLCSDNNSNNSDGDLSGDGDFGNCMGMQDVWCGPGIGFSGADAVVGSVDCVVTRRNASTGRGKIDGGEKFNQRERERGREGERPCLTRLSAVTPEAPSFLDTDRAFVTSCPEQEVSATRYYRHNRHPSPDGLARMMVLQSRFIMGGRLDHFSNWRLDIDHMTYEQLLELGDRIGYVNTGLKEDEISSCVKKINPSIIKERPSHLPMILEKKCSICQDEFEEADEVGKLDCGHGFHMQCIKQWLAQKNTCPVCKTEPVARG
ncbi:zinc finger family protein [Salix suchowensis]|nr:zinc finger family protein [Salix suchowensis]